MHGNACLIMPWTTLSVHSQKTRSYSEQSLQNLWTRALRLVILDFIAFSNMKQLDAHGIEPMFPLILTFSKNRILIYKVQTLIIILWIDLIFSFDFDLLPMLWPDLLHYLHSIGLHLDHHPDLYYQQQCVDLPILCCSRLVYLFSNRTYD